MAGSAGQPMDVLVERILLNTEGVVDGVPLNTQVNRPLLGYLLGEAAALGKLFLQLRGGQTTDGWWVTETLLLLLLLLLF